MKIPVLMYHKVASGKREKYSISPEKFASQMEYLSKKGYQTISPDELLGFIKRTSVIKAGRGTLPQRPVLITFDDGYKDNFTHAYPILKRYNFRATIFLITQYIGQKNGWSKAASPEGLPSGQSPSGGGAWPGGEDEEILSWEEIKEMKKEGFSFGSHTCTHANLLRLAWHKVLPEIEDSKRMLEERLEEPVRFFAYPYGKFDSQLKEMVKEAGYLGAFSTLPGKNGIAEDPFLLRRILIRGYDTKFHFSLNLKLGRSRI